MEYDLKILFLLFIIYSVIGWTIEFLQSLVLKGKAINRGFLIGPYCPIYGVGIILMILLLTKYLDDTITLFIMSILLFSFIEYVTSYYMEKIFKVRWWDYSQYKFNINGRICLEAMVIFGLGGVFIMYIVNPLFINLLNLVPNILLTIFSIIILVIFIIDVFVSVFVISSIKKTAKKIKQDNTEEITQKVKKALLDKNYIKRRIVKAFPKLKIK